MAKGDPCEECGEWIDWCLHHECPPEHQLERERMLSADLASRLKQAQETHERTHAGWSADTRTLAGIRTILDNYESDEFLSADRALGEISEIVQWKVEDRSLPSSGCAAVLIGTGEPTTADLGPSTFTCGGCGAVKNVPCRVDCPRATQHKGDGK